MLIIIGLLFVAAAITVGIDVAAMNQNSIDIEAFGQVWTSSPSVAFVAGAVTALVGAVGLALIFDGGRRARTRRRTVRKTLAERDELASQLEHQSELAGGRPTVDERDSVNLDLRDRERAAR